MSRILLNDPFDEAMNATLQVFEQGATGVDGYGLPITTYTLIQCARVINGQVQQYGNTAPCRADPEQGQKLATEVAFGIQKYTVWSRPLMVIPSAIGSQPIPLSIHHFLLVSTVGDSSSYLNLQNIINPAELGHHLEIEAKLVEP
jgi:hypothetical protein